MRPGVQSPQWAESPLPTVLTAQFHPVYTFGRRNLRSVSDEQRRYLEDNGKATVVQAQRGGQLTFHGPGQLVAYPIIDLRRHYIRPRQYIRLLEETVMAVCSRLGVEDVEVTDDPGIWMKGGQRKICAVGVHIQRGITGHGIGLNVVDNNKSLSWGFGRIVACGLPGKEVTWLDRERPKGKESLNVNDVASYFVNEFAVRLSGIHEIHHNAGSSFESDTSKEPLGISTQESAG